MPVAMKSAPDASEREDFSLLVTQLQRLQERPEPFALGHLAGEPRFWDDPYICEQLLAEQIDAHADGASRRLRVVEEEVAWLVAKLGLEAGQAVLDLGCGPGLYATRLAQRRLAVTGVDYARCALDYAAQAARDQGLEIDYRYQDYLELDERGAYDAALLVNGDFSSHSPAQRARLLGNLHRALKPGGCLALEVLTRVHCTRYGIRNQWYVVERGFWRPGRHLVLEEGFCYPREDVYLNQYVIVEAGGKVTVYRNWFQAYTPERITAELESQGFAVEHVGGNMRGGAYNQQSEWIAVLARQIS